MKYLPIVFLSCFTQTIFGVSPYAYVTNGNGTTVQIIDINANTVQSIFGFSDPRVIKITADGTQALVGQSNDLLLVIDTLTHNILPMNVSVQHPISLALTPDNLFAYILSSNGTVSVIKIPEYTLATVLSGFNNPADIKISPDGTFAYVTNSGDGTISVMRTSDNIIVATIVGMKNPLGITFTNDGEYAYVTDTKNDCIYVIHTPNNSLVDQILGFNAPKYIAMSRDDNYFYVTNQGTDQVTKVRISDSQMVSSISLPTPSSIATTQDGLYYLVGTSLGSVFQISTLNDDIVAVFPGFDDPSNITTTTNNPPPISLNGCQINTNPENIFNRITWNPVPGDTPVNFKLYKDAALTHLIATLSPTATEFDHMNLMAGQTYSYYLVAEYANGFSTTWGNIQVNPARVCLGDM